MNSRSSIIIAAGLVLALMGGDGLQGRDPSLPSAAAPVRIVVQTAAPAAPTAPAKLAPVNPERD